MTGALILLLAILATSGAMIWFSGGRFARETGYMSRHEYRRVQRQAERAVAPGLCTPSREFTPTGARRVEVAVEPVVVAEVVVDRFARFEWLEVQS